MIQRLKAYWFRREIRCWQRTLRNPHLAMLFAGWLWFLPMIGIFVMLVPVAALLSLVNFGSMPLKPVMEVFGFLMAVVIGVIGTVVGFIALADRNYRAAAAFFGNRAPAERRVKDLARELGVAVS